MIKDRRTVINKIEEYAKKKMALLPSDHDIHGWGHVSRVRNWALKINKQEKKVDDFYLEIVTLLHDIGRNQEEDHCIAGERIVKEFLPELNYFKEEEINMLAHSVRFHGPGSDDDLTQILQDADKLDLIGPIGLIRAAMHHHNLPLCHSIDDFREQNYRHDEIKSFVDRGDDGKSIIDYFIFQLSILKNNLHTETARKFAKKKIEYNKGFFKELKEELF